MGPQGFGGSGEKGFLFSGNLGSLRIIFRAHSFGDLGSPAKSKKNLSLKEKPSFRLIFFKEIFGFWGEALRPSLKNLNVFTYMLTMLIWIGIGHLTDMANFFYYCGKSSLKLLIFRLIITYFLDQSLRMRQIAPF